MDHEVYEKEMIAGVNRNAEKKKQYTSTVESTVEGNRSLFTKTDAVAIKRGLKRMAVALLTTVLFGLAVYGFIATATAPGYAAVLLFIISIVELICAFVFLYAQGITHKAYRESQGESK